MRIHRWLSPPQLGLLGAAVARPPQLSPVVDTGVALILLAAVLALVLMRRISRGQFVEGSNGPVFLRHSHARLAAATASAARFARLSHLVESRINSPAVMLESEARAAREKLRELALDHLRQIRYQQSFSRERSIAVKVGGAPIGVDVDGKRGETWQERPKSYPELVAELRTFIAAVAEKYVVVIGVDELDKLRSPDAVEHFLNDIKGVFGATGCFFLVSVSEDAAASFERRGVPFRDVFDSTFDDVISVRHLDLRAARKVLHGLLLGWTEPFIGLCYVLSGGLPRDLRRMAQQLISHRTDGDEIELGAATLAMSRRETEARFRAVQHELMREPFDLANVELLTRIADLTPATATLKDLRTWHDDLASSQPAAETDSAASRLSSELAAFTLWAATIVQFFDPHGDPSRIRATEDPTAGPKGLATLAAARLTLAQSSGLSLAHTTRFRTGWGL